MMRTFVEWILDSIPHEFQKKGDIECYEKGWNYILTIPRYGIIDG
ncbi:MAG TPA: hypothetical protein VF222_09650 [Nitrososphaeraceae archaeon]